MNTKILCEPEEGEEQDLDRKEDEQPRELGQDEAPITYQCGANDDPDENVGNATSPVDVDSGKIEEGNTYLDKLIIDLENLQKQDRE